MVSTHKLSMRARDFNAAKKCVARRQVARARPSKTWTRAPARTPSSFAKELALHGEDYATTCSEGVTYVEAEEAYADLERNKGVASVGAFARERETAARRALSCGGRLDPPTGSRCSRRWRRRRARTRAISKTTSCGERLDPREEAPRFGKCLFARKFADDASRDFTREWRRFAIGT